MSTGRSVLKKLLGSEFLGPIIAGQPTSSTHPKLIKLGELTPGIQAAEYAARREALVKSLPSGSIAIVAAALGQFMTGNIPYPYRQDANFSYLTGVNQPHAVAVLGAEDSSVPGYTLFVSESTNHDATWTGLRINKRAAVEVFGADESHHITKMPRLLGQYIASSSRIFCDLDTRGGPLLESVPALRKAIEDIKVYPLKASIHALRWRKSEAEIRLMRSSARAASGGIRQCMELSSPNLSEQKLAAAFEHYCKMRGAKNLAYPSVVAGGADATTIHYGENDKEVQDGELLLMDAGCERYGYASDVSRTWPVSGRFKPEQRAVYDIVLEIYRNCLQQCRLGVSLRDIHQHSIRLVSEGIADLGLLPGKPASFIAQHAYREFYPHSVGHWLGMDTHDSSSQGLDPLLQPNVVMTLEPGIYVPDDPKYGHFAGIGVRLEDDIVIKQGGPDVLSDLAPLDASAVEEVVGTADLLDLAKHNL